LADTNSFSDPNDVIDQPADSVPIENPEGISNISK